MLKRITILLLFICILWFFWSFFQNKNQESPQTVHEFDVLYNQLMWDYTQNQKTQSMQFFVYAILGENSPQYLRLKEQKSIQEEMQKNFHMILQWKKSNISIQQTSSENNTKNQEQSPQKTSSQKEITYTTLSALPYDFRYESSQNESACLWGLIFDPCIDLYDPNPAWIMKLWTWRKNL